MGAWPRFKMGQAPLTGALCIFGIIPYNLAILHVLNNQYMELWREYI